MPHLSAIAALRFVLPIFLLALLGPLGPARAQDIAPEDAVARLFTTEAIDEAWLASSFTAEVPVATLQGLVDRLTSEHGAFVDAVEEGDGIITRLQQAEIPTEVTLDGHGRIIGLFFRPPVARGSLADSVTRLTDLPGRVAVLVTRNDEDLTAVNADQPLPVASAAKLAILAAVAEAVEADELAWDDVVHLDPAWQSLPSGILQDWPADTPMTVASLTILAISQSDNTAADALLRLVGRAAVEAHYPRGGRFATTREVFLIAGHGLDATTRAWLAGEGERPGYLDGPVDGAVALGALDGPALSQAGWTFSAREICALLDRTAGLPAFSVNPGVAERADWTDIAFKGGSLPGVLNLSTRVEDADGNAYCVVVTRAGEASVPQEQLTAPYAAILGALADGG